MQPKVTVKKWLKRNKEIWVVRYRECGKAHHAFFDKRKDAEAEAGRKRDQIEKSGQAWNDLTPPERAGLISVWDAAKQRGLDLSTIIAKATPEPGASDKTLGATITDLIAEKKTARRSDRYVDGLELILNQFSKGREGWSIATLPVSEVKSFLASKSIASRATLRSRLSTLFKYAVREGYRPDNPCARLERVSVAHKPPAIFTVEQVSQCLAFLRSKHKPSKYSRELEFRHALPWFVLSTFCGLRPEEAEKTTKKDINTREGWIKVEAQTSKIRQRRPVYPPRPAIRLLASVLKKGRLPLHPRARKRVIKRLRGLLGFRHWPKDITRHTAASYWLASCESTASVAKSLGNSETVLMRHYAALVTRKDAKRFWKLAG